MATAPLAGVVDARSATRHLWPHGSEEDWDDLVAGERLNVFESGNGCMLVDTAGREYFDGLSGLFVVNVGHGRREIGEAMAAQASRLAYTASANAANTASVELAEKVASLTPRGLDRIFFCSGGSEAVESALKIAKQAQALRGYPKRYKVICRRGSYHGSTAGAMAVTDSSSERFFGPFAPGVSRVPSPNRYRNDFGMEGEAGDLMCARYVEQEIINQGAETVAAVIAEPISASNGTHIPSKAYWNELRAVCDRHGVLLIADEVITGYGRTGSMFAIDHFGVVPDIMTMAKGFSSGYAPIAAVAVDSSIFDLFTGSRGVLRHLLTFGGNAVSAAAALRNIQIIEEEELVARAADRGARLLTRAEELREHPTVGDVRGGLGLLCGIELVKNKTTRESWGVDHPFIKDLAAGLRRRGVVTRVWDVLHLAPPLIVTEAEIDQLVEAVGATLSEIEHIYAREIDH